MTLNSNHKNRLYELDGLRGFAAIWVGLYHFWGPIQKRNVDWVPQLVEDFFKIGFFGVDIFFVLSGFVIMHSISGAKIDSRFVPRFMLRRSIRIDPPYWFAIIGVIILMLLKEEFFPQEQVNFPTFKSIIAHIFYLQDLINLKPISGVFWTLCLEFQFYLIFSLTYYCYKKADFVTRKFYEKAFVILGLIFCFISPILRFASVDFLVPGTIFPYAYEFALGVFTYFWIKGDLENRVIFLAIALTTLSTVLLRPFYYSLIPFSVIIFLYLSSRGDKLSWMKSRLMLFLGRISYSFYLIHASIGWVSISLMLHYFSEHEGKAVTFFIFLSGILVSIVVSTVFYLVVEKPSLRISKKFKMIKYD